MNKVLLLFIIVFVSSIIFFRFNKNKIEKITITERNNNNIDDSKNIVDNGTYEQADFKSAIKQVGDCCSPTTLCKCLPMQLPENLSNLDISRVWTSTRPGGNLDHKKIDSAGANTSAGHPQIVAFKE